jgi:trans-aconitate methyltransferase
MPAKPPQFSMKYGGIFQDASVISAYRYRPMYPDETFRVLLRLMPPAPAARKVLDAGCGTGFIARPLAAHVDHIDAVDISEGMIATAQTQPGGEQPNITWIAAPVETAPLSGPYALIVAAASLHWMDWERALPRFANLLVLQGRLALVEEIHAPAPWDRQMASILRAYSMNQDFTPYSMVTLAAELEQRRLFQREDQFETAAVLFQQSIDAYVAAAHARNGFSLDRMDPQAAGQFDAALRAALEPFCPGGVVEQWISARIVWGYPLGFSSSIDGSVPLAD